MAWDRNKKRLDVGMRVLLTTGMALNNNRKGVVQNIDGEDITVRILSNDNWGGVLVHRYGSEMEVI